MAQLQRVYRTHVDASPNQICNIQDASIGLKQFSAYNPGSADAFLSFYQETSGSVTVGTTARTYGPFKIPAGEQVVLVSDDQSNPLQSFMENIVVAATTTSGGSTSPADDIEVEITFWG